MCEFDYNSKDNASDFYMYLTNVGRKARLAL